MLLARVEIAGAVRDLRVTDDRVAEIAERLRPAPDEDVLDAGGRALLPGLHDHHLHLRSLAAASGSVDLRDVTDEEGLRHALAAAARGDWVRAVGYHEAMAGDLDRRRLDELTPPGVSVRVQHRSGVLWILNSAALTTTGLDRSTEAGVDREAGRLWRRDDLLRDRSSLDGARLAEVGAAAAALGVTGFTDASPDGTPTDARELGRDLRRAGVPQRLTLMAPVGAVAPDTADTSLGPVKVLLDDVALPPLDDLTTTIRRAHADGRVVAIHCVTRVQLVLAVTAFDTAGPAKGDRIEHGSVIPPDLVGRLARLDLTVVTQPHFVAERGDEYRRDVPLEDQDSLYRLRSLIEGGVSVAAGTDAPFGAPDPWASMAAAVDRRTRSGGSLGAEERVDLPTALDLYLGAPDAPARPRRIAPGVAADLCLLDVPSGRLREVLGERPVEATFIGGELVHRRG